MTSQAQMEQTRAVELLNIVKSEAELIIQRMGLTVNHFDLTLDEGEHFDPTLDFDGSDITVYCYNDKAGHECFSVARMTYYPGVRYYPDGSGEPPSEDLDDIKEFVCMQHDITSTAFAVAAFALENAFRMLVDKACEGRGEELAYNSLQEMYKGMERDQGLSVLDGDNET